MYPENYFKRMKPDTRILMLQTVLLIVISIWVNRPLETLSLFLVIDGVLFILGLKREAIIHGLLYMFFFLANMLLTQNPIPIISMMFTTLFLTFLRVYPIYLSLILLVKRAKMDEILYTLEGLKVPKTFILPLAVVYRYIPTISYEIKLVKESLKIRGISTSIMVCVLHPIRSTEYFMIPLLIRSGKLSEELAAASLCKGLNTHSQRTVCVQPQISIGDVAYSISGVAIAGLLMYVHQRGLLA